MSSYIPGQLADLTNTVRRLTDLYQRSTAEETGGTKLLISELAALRSEIGHGQNSHLRKLYAIYAQLIALRLPLDPALLRAPRLHVDLPEAKGVNIEESEEALARDSSQPALWLAAGAAQWTQGNRARGQQLLRRLASSGFAEKDRAQSILADLVFAAYGCEAR